MQPIHISATLLGILLSATIQAGVYRWVDENGVTVYSQVPPPVEIQKKRMDIPAPPPTTEKEAWQELNHDWKKMRDRQDLVTEQAIADSEQNEKKQAEETNCNIAQRTIEQLDNSLRRLVKTASGYTRPMPASEREERLQKAREMEKKYCN